MKHMRTLTRRPAPAQFEPVLQIIGIIQAILSIPITLFSAGQLGTMWYVQLSDVFGFTIPQKEAEENGLE
jgi:hypothetical protein